VQHGNVDVEPLCHSRDSPHVAMMSHPGIVTKLIRQAASS